MHVLVLGAGQLARMMSLAGAPLNIEVTAFDVTSEDIVHPLTKAVVGHGLKDAITSADVITAEFEHIPHDILEQCDASGKLFPSTDAIKAGGDRRLEKQLLDSAQVRNAKYYNITCKEDLLAAVDFIGLPMVLKSALGGYDGKGQWRLKDRNNIESIWSEMAICIQESDKQSIVAEEFVPFDREVSLVGARDKNGHVVVYPLSENVHLDGVLSLSTAIEDSQLQLQAKSMFTAVANELDYVGVLALEFFDVGGKLLVNEIAPRVHNSGHWTQQGAEICQFENHLRAVCGLTLGSTEQIRVTSMLNILGEDEVASEAYAMAGVHVHWYGKEKRSGRKMGHINVCDSSRGEMENKLKRLSKVLNVDAFPVLKPFK